MCTVCMWVISGPQNEPMGLLRVKRVTEKKIGQKKQIEGDRRDTTSSKCNYMEAGKHTHMTLTLSLGIQTDMIFLVLKSVVK